MTTGRGPRLLTALAGLALIALAIVWLAGSGPSRLGSDGIAPREFVATLQPGEAACQDGVLVPAGATRVRVLAGTFGALGAVALTGTDGTLTVFTGRATFRDGPVDLPLGAAQPRARVVRLCLRNVAPTKLALAGRTGAGSISVAAGTAPALLSLVYPQSDGPSWLDEAGRIADRVAAGRFLPIGAPLLWLALALALGGMLLGTWVCLRKPLRPRRTALLCAGTALLSLLAWNLIVPPFQAPDEPTHLAYVQRLAETARPPAPADTARPPLSTQGSNGLAALNFAGIIGNPLGRPPVTGQEVRAADALLAKPAGQGDGGGASGYSSYPPGYYLLAAPAYLVADAAGATIVGDLGAVRLVSCLLSALTVLLLFLFARELLPGSPRAWAPAALSVGLLPYFGFIGSSANNDTLLAAVCAALFLALARLFRRGLTVRRAVEIALICVVGVLTKPTFFGLVPGAALALLLTGIPLARTAPRTAGRAAGAAALAAGVPFALYLALNTGVWGRPVLPEAGQLPGAAAAAPAAAAPARSVSGFLSYLWQFWLPRPGFLKDQVGGVYPAWETMFKGYVGRFGWLDYQLPEWVYKVVLAGALGLLALVGRALAVERAAVRRRGGELVTYLVLVAGLLLIIAIPGYRYRIDTGFAFEQGRYLFPILALQVALVALALRGAGARLAPYLAPLLILLIGALNVGALLVTVGRYYA